MRKSDIPKFWRNSSLFREKFFSDDTIVEIPEEFYPVQVGGVSKKSNLDDIIFRCEYWRSDSIPKNLITILRKLTPGNTNKYNSQFIKDFVYMNSYFESSNGIVYSDLVEFKFDHPEEELRNPIRIKLTEEPTISGRFRTLNELKFIANKVKNLRRFLSSYDIKKCFCHDLNENRQFNFEMYLIATINSDHDLQNYLGRYRPVNPFWIQTETSSDIPEFCLSKIAQRFIVSVSFSQYDINLIERFTEMDENKATQFTIKSFEEFF